MAVAKAKHKCFSCGYTIDIGEEEEQVPPGTKVWTSIRYKHASWEQCQQAARRPLGWHYRGQPKPRKR